jgi:AcrR family transcriptional regulator
MGRLETTESAADDRGGKRTTATRRSNRREQVLLTAAHLFLEQGFEATTIDQIADHSEISVPGVYYHFKSKQALLAAIVNQGLDNMDQGREKVTAHCKGHEDRLRTIVHGHALGLTTPDDAAFTIVAIEQTNALLPDDRKEITLRRRAHFDFIRETLDGLKAEGKLSDVDTTAAAFSVLAQVLWVIRWYKHGGRLTAEEVADEVTKLVMQSVIRPA